MLGAEACGEWREACGAACVGTRLRQTAMESSRDTPHRAKSERWLESASEMCRHRQRWGGARAGRGSRAGVRLLIVCAAPVFGDRSSRHAFVLHAVPPASVRVMVRGASGRSQAAVDDWAGDKGVNCDASQNPHRAWRRGQESGGARRSGALSVGRVPRRPSLMGGGTSQKLESPGVE